MALDRLSAQDAQILHLEGGSVRGHTCKVLVLERFGNRPLPTVEALREQVLARLDAAPRLRQRLVPTPLRVANPVWLDDPGFDVARHITRAQTSGPVSRAELDQMVARLMTNRLERSHPLWHLDVVEELEDGAMALIWRVHHCMADGTTSVRLGSSVLWSEDPYQVFPPAPAWMPQGGPGEIALFALGLLDQAQRAGRRQHPSGQRLPSRHAWSTVIKRELAPSAVLTPLASPVGAARTVAFAMAPLDDCKRAGKAIHEGATLNDVVLAIVTGGVRAWLEQGRGPERGIRVKVPVSLHHGGEDDGVANRDSYFFVDLPVGEADPSKRLRAISRETSERKLEHDAETLYRLGRHPFLARWAMSPHVFTFNVSNVRGPSNDVYVCGARIRELYSVAEIAQLHALRVTVISAAGTLFFGLCADRGAVKDLQVLADGLRGSTDELLRLA